MSIFRSRSSPESTKKGRGVAKKSARILFIVVAFYAAVVSGVVLYGIPMPGRSFSGIVSIHRPDEPAIASELRAHVTALSKTIGERRAVLGNSLARAEAYLTRELELAHVVVERESLAGAPGNPANLVVNLEGKVPGPIVLVGAHYDTSIEGTPGANDNASGTASLLFLVKRLAEKKRTLPLRFVFFANEEPPYFAGPLMGSKQHAAGCKKRGEEFRAVLSLETMGFYSDAPGSQKYPRPLNLLYPDRGNFIAFVGDLQSRTLVRDVIREFRQVARIPSEGAALPSFLQGIGWSDHASFWAHGYPALMVTDTALFRDPHYHQATDVVENLDFERLALVVSGLEKTVERLSSP